MPIVYALDQQTGPIFWHGGWMAVVGAAAICACNRPASVRHCPPSWHL